MLHSKFTTVVLGLVLIAYAVFDVYEELFEPSHEHILIVIGVIMILNAFGHAHEGIHKIAHELHADKEYNLLERAGLFFRHRVVRIVLGITVLITSMYGLYEDYEKIHSKSVSMSVGLLMMVLPIMSTIMGSKNLSKGIMNDHSDEVHEERNKR